MDKVKIIDKVNNAIMEREYGIIHAVYIDLSLMKDLKLGLMLAISSPEERQYLIDNLDTYNKRVDRKFTTCFPKFKYSEEALNAMYHSEDFSDFIIDFAPDTDLSLSLYEFLKQIDQRNYRAQYRDKVDVVINTYPLHDTEVVQSFKDLFLQVNSEVPGFTFSFVNQDPFTIASDYWSKFDVLIVDDIAHMCAEGTPWRNPIEATSWLSKTVYAPPCISDDVLKSWEENKIKVDDELKQLTLEITEQTLRLCCKFQFASFVIPIDKPEEKEGE